MRARAGVLLVAVVAVLVGLVAPAAAADTLTEPSTGLTVTAPGGYAISRDNGVFTLSGKGRYVQFMSIRSPLGVQATGQVLLTGIHATKVTAVKVQATRFSARAKVGGRPVTVRVTQAGDVSVLAVYGRTRTRSLRATPTRSRPGGLTARQIAGLDRILATRAGEPVPDVNIGIPTKTFQAPVQNGASATVPDLPGWQYGGTDTGYLYGGHPTDGAFELGSFIFVNYPNVPYPAPQFPTAPIQSPQDALVNVFTAWKRMSGVTISIDQVNGLAGTEGNLGTGYLSQAFEARLTINGGQYRGLFNIGVMDNAGSFLSWGFYYSYVLARVDGPSGILASLMTTWGSWNNSAASLARLQDALRSLQGTRVPGAGPIDPDVFQSAADAWGAYIRGSG